MKRIKLAIETIRGWSDKDLKDFIITELCPSQLKIDTECIDNKGCRDCWNEEEAE